MLETTTEFLAWDGEEDEEDLFDEDDVDLDDDEDDLDDDEDDLFDDEEDEDFDDEDEEEPAADPVISRPARPACCRSG